MMRNELGLERPDERAAPRSAATVGGGYVLAASSRWRLTCSCRRAHRVVLVDPLHVARAIRVRRVRARVLATPVVLGAVQTWFIGALAAAAAYGLARLVSHAI